MSSVSKFPGDFSNVTEDCFEDFDVSRAVAFDGKCEDFFPDLYLYQTVGTPVN